MPFLFIQKKKGSFANFIVRQYMHLYHKESHDGRLVQNDNQLSLNENRTNNQLGPRYIFLPYLKRVWILCKVSERRE